MRIEELLGLKTEYVLEDYIHVCARYAEGGECMGTKTHDMRDILITPFIYEWLDGFMRRNAGGYVFSEDGGRTLFRCGTEVWQVQETLFLPGVEKEIMRQQE
jgi:hypothetical protein